MAKIKSKLRRLGWLLLALLFLGTALGIGLYSFWQANHQSNQNNSSQKANKNQITCTIDVVQNQAPLPAPEIYKPDGSVTKLGITDLEPGSGAAVKAGDCLTVKYYGTLASDGTKFDEDFTVPSALKLQIGRGQVIQGWDQGVIGMKPGGVRRLVLPADLGYGSQAQGSIPANSALVFVVKLLNVQ